MKLFMKVIMNSPVNAVIIANTPVHVLIVTTDDTQFHNLLVSYIVSNIKSSILHLF